jgi:hypothetical protein
MMWLVDRHHIEEASLLQAKAGLRELMARINVTLETGLLHGLISKDGNGYRKGHGHLDW